MFSSKLVLTCMLACLTNVVVCAAQAEQRVFFNISGYTPVSDNGSNKQIKPFNILAINNGKIELAIQTSDYTELRSKYAGYDWQDGQGQTVLPGIIDAHGHIYSLGAALLRVDLRDTTSEAQAVQRVADYAKANPDSEWITGRGWNQVLWPGKNFPDKASLDALQIDKPIVLGRVDGHAVWVNSKALQMAGIDAQTADPDGGQIVRDASGEATGVLIDNAELMVTRLMTDPSEQQINRSLDKAFAHLLSLGITSAHDAGLEDFLYPIYQQRAAKQQLPVRVYGMLNGSSPQLPNWLAAGPIHSQDDSLSIRSVKLYADGALGSRGAAMLSDYSDQANHQGLLLTPPEQLNQLVQSTINSGFQANIHAIGDRGNRVALEAIAQAYKNLGKGSELRNRVEHAQVINTDDIPRFKDLNIIASMQPTHATSDMNMAEARVGSERIKGAYAWRTLLNQGTVIASGSDFPVELANPWHGIYSAVARMDHSGQPTGGWKPEQAMSLAEALISFTLDAAYAAHQEHTLGSLEPGKWADFVVLKQDPFKLPASQLWQLQVEQTWVAGKKRYQR